MRSAAKEFALLVDLAVQRLAGKAQSSVEENASWEHRTASAATAPTELDLFVRKMRFAAAMGFV